MRLEPSRRLVVSLWLGLALSLGTVFPTGAATVSTLTGETLPGSSTSGNSGVCFTPTYSVGGTASGPYPGTFSETGGWSQMGVDSLLNATFTITSGTTTVTGSKAGPLSKPGDFLACGLSGGQAVVQAVPYTAVIHTPDGNFEDRGVSNVSVTITKGGAATLTESFTSSLAAPVLIVPTSISQCQNNGWRNYPQFKNQGACVSFVVRPT